jgi:cytochrome c553
MFNVAHVLSPAMLKALAEHFRDLNPKPLGGASKELVAAGKKIYEDGVPSAEVPPCATCHGPEAKGADAFPRLAGQQPEYLTNQLQAFIDRRRTNPVMFTVAHVLSPAMLKALSEHFRDLNPKPLGGGSKELAAAGKKIYEDGVPSAEVPPCATCHGPEAKGADAFPRLAGQLNDYVAKKLLNWSKERGQDPAKPDNSAIMQPIAHGLTEDQVNAVAAYLSYLE